MASDKPMVFLDLDQTLISAEAIEDFPFKEPNMREKALNFAIHDMDGYYIIFERPHVQDFLDYLFENYRVSVWTAASKDYALFVIKYIVLRRPNRQLEYILFSYHCELSKQFFKSSKDLRLVWDTFRLDGITPKNSLIIDDLDEVYECQPRNAIHIPAFEILDNYSEHDKELQSSIKNQLTAKFVEMAT